MAAAAVIRSMGRAINVMASHGSCVMRADDNDDDDDDDNDDDNHQGGSHLSRVDSEARKSSWWHARVGLQYDRVRARMRRRKKRIPSLLAHQTQGDPEHTRDVLVMFHCSLAHTSNHITSHTFHRTCILLLFSLDELAPCDHHHHHYQPAKVNPLRHITVTVILPTLLRDEIKFNRPEYHNECRL